MIIRKADEADMPAILSLVHDVFSAEQGIPADMNPIPSELRPVWWAAMQEDVLIGCAAAYFDKGGCHIGRIAVHKDYRGSHRGRQLIAQVLTELFTQDIDAVTLEARPATVHIILSMGGRITGESFPFYSDTCTPLSIGRNEFHP